MMDQRFVNSAVDLIRPAIPFLVGLTSVTLDGPFDAMQLFMEPLDAAGSLANVTEMCLRGVSQHPINSAQLHSQILMPQLSTMNQLQTLVIRGAWITFADLTTALADLKLSTLSLEVREFKGLLSLQSLRKLSLQFNSRAAEHILWSDCFQQHSFRSLSECTLSQSKRTWADLAVDQKSINQPVMNRLMQTIVRCNLGLVSLKVNNLDEITDSVNLESDTQQALSQLPALHSVVVGHLNSSVALRAVTFLGCFDIPVQHINLVPNATRLSLVRLVPDGVLPARITTLETLDFDPFKVCSYASVQHLDVCFTQDWRFDQYQEHNSIFDPLFHQPDFSILRNLLTITLTGLDHKFHGLEQILRWLQLAPRLQTLCMKSCIIVPRSISPPQTAATSEILGLISSLGHVTCIQMSRCNMSKQALSSIAGKPSLLRIEVTTPCKGITWEDAQEIKHRFSVTSPALTFVVLR